MSQNLMLMFASILPEEVIIEQIEKKLCEYKITKSKEVKESLTTYCMLLASKEVTEREGLEKVLKDSNEIQKIHERLSDNKLG